MISNQAHIPSLEFWILHRRGIMDEWLLVAQFEILLEHICEVVRDVIVHVPCGFIDVMSYTCNVPPV